MNSQHNFLSTNKSLRKAAVVLLVASSVMVFVDASARGGGGGRGGGMGGGGMGGAGWMGGYGGYWGPVLLVVVVGLVAWVVMRGRK